VCQFERGAHAARIDSSNSLGAAAGALTAALAPVSTGGGGGGAGAAGALTGARIASDTTSITGGGGKVVWGGGGRSRGLVSAGLGSGIFYGTFSWNIATSTPVVLGGAGWRARDSITTASTAMGMSTTMASA
jgi:hypothetical protein